MAARAKTAKPRKKAIARKRATGKSRARPGSASGKKALGEYSRKRDFTRTPEPKPAPGPAASGQFVVQKHDARRLHYDLRLELDGVLKSWAVTRGPSLTVGEKRLAVHTEDHPVKYLNFEGNIPKGEYGGGSMIVWDRGPWHPEGDPHKGLAKGHLDFTLDGARLKGRWHLVRMRKHPGEKSEPWLLIKADDQYARHPGDPEITDEEVTSRVSGRTNQELAAAGEVRADHQGRKQATKNRKLLLPDISRTKGARKGLLPTFLEPALSTPVEKPPSGPKWIHEIKHDGYRIEARIDGREIQLFTRKALDWTERFQPIADALAGLGLGSALIDGEIIVEDAAGLSSFNNLQADLSDGRGDRFRYIVFDLLYCEGFDLTGVALIERKRLLHAVVSALPTTSPIRFSEHLETDGPIVLEHSCRLGLEGIISKRADLPYRAGRGDNWLKAKCRKSQEFVILGYVVSTAASKSIGALLLGYHKDGALFYAGRVGTGWSAALAKSLYGQLSQIAARKPALARPMPAGTEKGVGWSEPKLVCEVEFRDWTRDGLIRQASFKGLREDRPAEEVTLEGPQDSSKAPAERTHDRLTHPERILWPEPGITKQGLADFYTDIADWILPHITGRVLTALRAPSGTGAKSFFAKHPWAGLSDAVERIEVGEKEPMLAIHDLHGLMDFVQASVVELHPWGSRVNRLENPDRLIFDLDPDTEVPWSAVIAAARDVRARLESSGLKSFVKTTGGKGLHVVVPIEPRDSWDKAKSFAASVAQTMAREHPDRYVATMAKRVRHGRIFIDYLRNDRGSTAVAAYSTRASAQATVSTPLDWEELSESLRSDHFTVGNLRHRLGFLKQDPWADIFKTRQRVPG